MREWEKLDKAVSFLKDKMPADTTLGVVLGSGLGDVAKSLENATEIDYKDIPNFPLSSVVGHSGEMIFGTLSGKNVVLLSGRIHYYEGYTMQNIVFPVRVLKLLGIESLIITNAAGGINLNYKPGDLMLISDHIKFFDESPLRGKNIDELGERFNDMSEAYSHGYIDIAKSAAKRLNINLRQGVYAFMSGPSFETPAEIKALRILGADAVGMSTVPEVIAASHSKMKVLGISCITNMAAGILNQPLTHQEVLEVGAKAAADISRLIIEIVKKAK